MSKLKAVVTDEIKGEDNEIIQIPEVLVQGLLSIESQVELLNKETRTILYTFAIARNIDLKVWNYDIKDKKFIKKK